MNLKFKFRISFFKESSNLELLSRRDFRERERERKPEIYRFLILL